MEQPFLIFKNINKTYDLNTPSEVSALSNVSFELEKGEFVIIAGSNAAGKSTLFNVIAGSTMLDEGEIILEGKSITEIPEHKKAKFISRVWQNSNNGIINSMTIAENLAMAKIRSISAGLHPGIKPEWKREFINILKKFDLGLEKRIDDRVELLSGGQKQIIVLIMATITHPKILLLDEHTASLDPRITEIILNITEKLVKENNITTLMITHNTDHAQKYGNRLIILDRGTIVSDLKGDKKRTHRFSIS